MFYSLVLNIWKTFRANFQATSLAVSGGLCRDGVKCSATLHFWFLTASLVLPTGATKCFKKYLIFLVWLLWKHLCIDLIWTKSARVSTILAHRDLLKSNCRHYRDRVRFVVFEESASSWLGLDSDIRNIWESKYLSTDEGRERKWLCFTSSWSTLYRRLTLLSY